MNIYKIQRNRLINKKEERSKRENLLKLYKKYK